jgi:hypothetical protein
MAVARIKKYAFKGTVWKHKGTAGWHFVTIPSKLSNTIRKAHGLSEEGWGRLRATASIGDVKWQTAIWFDTKAKGYLLPIKALVRRKTKAAEGSSVAICLFLTPEERRFGHSKEL